MTDTKERPAPPAIEARAPDCPICWRETSFVDDCFECEDCGCYWPKGFDEPGEWTEPDEPQCTSTHQPFKDNPYVRDQETREQVLRCVLDDGHAGEHRHPDHIGEWTDASPNTARLDVEDEAPAPSAKPPLVVDVHLPEVADA
ncbi:hypothetical protein [Prauserella endophytica]|uniref:Uncharacterized protein n=1 Tax=Prauserella endophytica TaxID=1592324 RepID=A0ABY2S1K2_9PSEU|nr:hypothetical protein [Prauserella endophytica]PXY20351.1 hypothetical protein BAY59_31430 [Prauserella coralliicola]TKG66953.1 hypothetical protein FCN18_23875 [Prauserella endophytica]